MARKSRTGLALTLVAAIFSPHAAYADGHEGGGDAPLQVALYGPGLGAADLDRSIQFYRDGLGLKLVMRFTPGSVEEAIMSFGEDNAQPMLLLVKPLEGDPEKPSATDKLVLSVSDAAAMQARLRAAGYDPGEIHTHEASGTKIFWVTDPDGHRLEIVQTPAIVEATQSEEE